MDLNEDRSGQKGWGVLWMSGDIFFLSMTSICSIDIHKASGSYNIIYYKGVCL